MKKTLALILVGILAVVLIGYGAATLFSDDDPTIEENPIGVTENGTAAEKTTEEASTKKPSILDAFINVTETTTDEQTTEPQKILDYKYAYAGFQPAYANVEIEDWKMILVNRDYILPENYETELAPCITDDPDSLKLDYRVAPHYNEMYNAALKDGIKLVPVSGYRSVDRQERNFENKINKYLDQGYGRVEATQMAATIILPPGTSEHNAGLAMDICSLEQDFEETEEFRWLSENAADYGFILRYPEDKQDITKIIYEPWHWRYVGVEAAKEMKASGQCFEEYLGVA